MPIQTLVPCPACGQDIAPAANACPKCGNPNTWTHPEIQRFNQAVGSFTRTPPFGYEGKSFVLTGTAKVPEKSSTLADAGRLLSAVGLLSMIGGLFFPIIPFHLGSLAFIAGIVCLALAGKTDFKPTDQTKQFRIDFSQIPPRWSSDDDVFWQEVKEFFLPTT